MTAEEVLTEEDETSWPSSLHLLLCQSYTLHMFLKKVKTLKVIDFTQSKIIRSLRSNQSISSFKTKILVEVKMSKSSQFSFDDKRPPEALKSLNLVY